VIIDRRVNTGQTVVASLNAPSLFLLAKDLTRMQVWVAVNEADIGKIHPGQPVSFTVDAFPGETFRGEVGKVRLNASMTQNVVTYTVEVLTDNSAGRLLPYLTANVQFELDRRSNVLMVPNAALRWTPSPDQIVPQPPTERATRPAPSSLPSQSEVRNPKSEGPRAVSASGGGTTRGTLWIAEGKYVRPLSVQVGPSDGSMTEVLGRGLTEGREVVTGIQAKASGPADSTNPFTPRFPRRGPSGAGGPRGGRGPGGPPSQ
jgi:HlyD family secretion protein